MDILTTPRKPTPFTDRFHLATHIEREGRRFYVSTVDLRNLGNDYETMVFPCNEAGEVTSWRELLCRRYDTEAEAALGHQSVCEGFVAPPLTTVEG